MSRTIYVMDNHDSLLHLWRSEGTTGLKVVHVDFHCDMRNLLVDRRKQEYFIKSTTPADPGNFLSLAVIEGIVSSVNWLHYVPGGRKHDVETVSYTSDLTGFFRWLFYKLTNKESHSLEYMVGDLAEWSGIESADTFLDIDWDTFACTYYDDVWIEERADMFLSLLEESPQFPNCVAICYSPNYIYETEGEFDEFVRIVAEILDADIVSLGMELILEDEKPPSFLKKLGWQISLLLRKVGIY